MDAPVPGAEMGAQPQETAEPKVRITIRVEGSSHRITRAGRVDKVARDFSLDALLRQAVNPSLLRVMRELAPAQFEAEQAAVEEISNAVANGYHLRINDAEGLLPPSAWSEKKAKDHLAGETDPETSADFRLGLTLVPPAYAQAQPQPQPEPAETETQAQPEPVEQEAPAPSQPKPRVPKVEQLKEQLREAVAALNFEGLFCGNPEMQARQAEEEPRLTLLDSRLISEYFINANALRRRGEFERALSYYTVLVKCEGQNPVYWYLLGKTLLDLGRSEDASSALHRAESLGHEGATRELSRLNAGEQSPPMSA